MTDKNFHELIRLDELFDNGKRTFFIPDYQRGYSWEERQCRELIEDLERILKRKKEDQDYDEYTHFMGTIVAFPSENFNGNYEVVDGQQRLTTLSILLACLCHRLNHAPTLQSKISDIFLLKKSSNSFDQRLRLGKIGEQNDIFYDLIKKGKISENIKNRQWIKSDKILSDAYNFFLKYLESSKFSPEEILNTLRKDIGFILYKPSTSLETSVMFEVINNRGKELSELEKVKNWLHYRLHHDGGKRELERFHAAWSKMLENLNKAEMTQNEDENSFLRYCWIVFGDTDKNKSHHVYDSLKIKNYSVGILMQFVDFLETASSIYVNIAFASSYKDRTERYLQRIKYHSSQMSITPLILSVLSNQIILNEDKADILKLIERMNFRYYCCGIRKQSNSDQAYFYNLAHRFHNQYGEHVNFEEDEMVIVNKDWLKRELKNFTSKNANNEKFEQALRNEDQDFANWRDIKFFLASYEYSLNGKNNVRKNLDDYMYKPQDKKDGNVRNNNLYQIEHIWARKCDDHLNSEKAKNVKERYLGRLGNFILLNAGSNASNSKDPIEKKVNQYMVGKEGRNFDKSLSVEAVVKNFNEIISKNEKPENDWWDPYFINIYEKFLDKNEQDLIDFALIKWAI